MHQIRWVLIVGIAAVELAGAVGCCSQKLSPAIAVPERPQLVPIDAELWSSVDERTRQVLTDNQEKIFRYVEQLEAAIREYEKWRTQR